MPENNNLICWVILAGGKASRMGGSDKGLISVNGITLVQHVYQALAAQTETMPIYINANRNLDIYREYANVICDTRPGYQGPLAGIEVSLQQLESNWVGFTPCDCPAVSPQLIERLTAQLDPEKDVYVAQTGDKLQPVFSVWNKKVLPRLSRYLENGDRKFMLFLQQCNTCIVDFSDQPDAFINLNSAQDVAEFSKHKFGNDNFGKYDDN